MRSRGGSGVGRGTIWRVGGLAAALCAAWGAIGQTAQTPAADARLVEAMENVRVPLQKHDNGRVRALLRARVATLPPTGVVQGEGVRIELFDALGALEGIMIAENATIDQRRGRGQGTGPVRFEQRGVIIEGLGLTWEANKNLLRIESNAVVHLDRGGVSLVEGLP